MKLMCTKISLIVLFTIISTSVFSNNQILGSIRKGNNQGEVDLYFQPNFTNISEHFTNIQIVLTIPDAYASNTTVLSCISSNLISMSVADFNNSITRSNFNSRAVFKCTTTASNLLRIDPFTINTEFKVATFKFNDALNKSTLIRLADFSNDATNSGAAFLVSTNSSGRVNTTSTTQRFYPSGTYSTVGTDPLTTNYYAEIVSPIILPVKLIDFTAFKNNLKCYNDLKWVVSSEVNFKNYEIQRNASGSNTNFISIALIEAQGATNYAITDNNPLIGLNYYRLKMNDNDGNFVFSKIVSVNNNCKNEKLISLYPNPTFNDINISGYKGKSKIIVYNMAGTKIAYYNTTNTNQKVYLNHLASGTYNIVVISEDGSINNFKVDKK